MNDALINQVHCLEFSDMCARVEDASIDAVITDPPYMGVKDSEWDNQWASRDEFIAWIETCLQEFKRILKPNGSLYIFASPRMASWVEVATAKYFNVLNNIVWEKPRFSTKAEMFDKETMRAYFPQTERIIFAEQYGADSSYQGALIDENSTYWSACEALKRSIFGDYLQAEFDRANVTRKQIAQLFPSNTGNLTGCVSNWLIGYNVPTVDQYNKMREYLNSLNGSEYLRREYEYLRREYEYLRRPFNANPYAPYTDVWTFKTVQAYEGKHECEKPLALMKHIVSMSTRENDIVFDPFCGSGATLDASRQLGRRFIGSDSDAHWVKYASKRVNQPYTLSLLGLLGNGE